MEKILNFVKYTDRNLQKIGSDHQVIGLSKGRNKYYSIGNTMWSYIDNKVVCTLDFSYFSYVAILK